ncbi:MAG: hypothetical protein WCS52_07020 [bacterium]
MHKENELQSRQSGAVKESAELLITDMRCALPAEAWTDSGARVDRQERSQPPAGKWQALPYRSQLYEGTMLRTVSADAAPLRIPLGRTGWHALYLVIAHASGGDTHIEARLTGDDSWRLVADANCSYVPDESTGTRGRLCEEPWMLADLTGRDLEVRFGGWNRGRNVGGHAALYAVRAVPLRAEEALTAATRRHRPLLLCSNDRPPFFSERFAAHEWDAACFNNAVLGAGKGFSYPSTVLTSSQADAWMLPPRLKAWCVHSGNDFLQQCIDKAHQLGKRFWMSIRPQGWVHAMPPYDQLWRSSFFVSHPEYRCLETNGTPLSTLSVAFPAVRAQIQAMFEEALDRGADGVTILFARGFALARYEEPVRTRFRELYDLEARDFTETDPRLRKVWAEFMTVWIRELRAMLDAKGPTALVKRRELSVQGGPCLEWNLAYGIDVEAWAKEGLVDVVMPYPVHDHTDRIGDTLITQPNGWLDIAAYAGALKGTATKLIPCLGDYMHPESLATLRQRTHLYYEAGATGVCRWDNEECMAGARLDDPEIQKIWHNCRPAQENPLIEIGGLRVDKFPPATAFA